MPRNIIATDYMTLDGVVQDPVGMENSGLGNWTGPFRRGPVGDRIKHEELMAAGALLLGRVTYDGFAAVWPTIDDPEGFATRINSLPKHVASRTLASADWNNRSSGMVSHRKYDSPLATRYCGHFAAGPPSRWNRKAGDCSMASTTSFARPLKSSFASEGSLNRAAYFLVSAGTSGRRNARRPNAVMNLSRQMLSDEAAGSQGMSLFMSP